MLFGLPPERLISFMANDREPGRVCRVTEAIGLNTSRTGSTTFPE